MEQRLLRLGDIVDDYCPRERRITNHAIVAVVENAIRQTRCATCDAEHVYKHGKEPRKRKNEPSTLFEEVMADLSGGQLVQPRAEPAAPAASSPLAAAPADPPLPDAEEPPPHHDGWLAHRQLIRATLPKIDGEIPPPRPIPEFTMHQRPVGRGGYGVRFSQGREGNVAPGHGRGRGPVDGNSHGNGNGHGNGQPRGDGAGRPGKSGRHRSRHRRPR